MRHLLKSRAVAAFEVGQSRIAGDNGDFNACFVKAPTGPIA
ncbi:MAG TPA: hypothetical protein VKB53_12020 [Gammaproteobacteria bacterium]|nr:hypothetical protein [Gammaproteobacteria bacterium]